MELWHCTRVGRSELKGSQCKKPSSQYSPGMYEGSQSDCILLATNGDIKAMYTRWVSKCAHTVHFIYCTKGIRGEGKIVGEQPCPIKYHSLKYIKIRDAPQVKEELFTNLLGCNFRDKNIRGMLLSTKRSSFIFRKVTASQFKGTVSGDFQAFSYEKNST